MSSVGSRRGAPYAGQTTQRRPYNALQEQRPYNALKEQEAARSLRQREGWSPLERAADAWRGFQEGPDIPRPSTAQSFIPVVGPAWQAAADLQDGSYGSAAFNGAMAVAEMLPVGVAVKGVNAARRGVGVLKRGAVTADAARKQLRRWGVARSGEEIHHTIPLNGLGRNVKDPRNHFALLKVLPEENHWRLTRSWHGKPPYDPVRRIWYGTTDWMKAGPVGLGSYGADSFENITRREPVPPRDPKSPR